jgi:hypothetical protein
LTQTDSILHQLFETWRNATEDAKIEAAHSIKNYTETNYPPKHGFEMLKLVMTHNKGIGVPEMPLFKEHLSSTPPMPNQA